MNTGPVRRITGDTFDARDGEVLVFNVLGKPAAARDASGKVHGKLRIREPQRLPAVLVAAGASAMGGTLTGVTGSDPT